MHLKTCITALAATLSLSRAIPTSNSQVKPDSSLRLVKTSEADPGIWVTEEDKISKYRAKNINLIDITDIVDPQTLQQLSGASPGTSRLAAVTYPTTVSHQTEANALIAKATAAGPQSWLKTLSELLLSHCFFWSLSLTSIQFFQPLLSLLIWHPIQHLAFQPGQIHCSLKPSHSCIAVHALLRSAQYHRSCSWFQRQPHHCWGTL